MRYKARAQVGPLDVLPGRQETDLIFTRGSGRCVYLIHGVTGTPAEMSYLGRKLAQTNGCDVYVTTLPGHCTRLRDLVRTTQQDWRTHVQTQLSFIRDRYEDVFVVGLSAGALLALDASTVVNVNGIGVLSPTFLYDGWNTPWSHTVLPLAMKMVPISFQRWIFHIDGSPYGIKDERLQASVRKSYRIQVLMREWVHDYWTRRKAPSGEVPPSAAASKGYPIFPLRTLTEINRLILQVQVRLQDVYAPTLILQAREDDMTSPRNSAIAYEGISSKDKHLILLDDCYHVITVDKQRAVVAYHVANFFRLHMKTETIPQQMRVSS